MKKMLRQWRMKLKNFRRRITYSETFTAIVAGMATALFYLLTKTLRIEYDFDPEFTKLDRQKICYGFWHGRLFLLVTSFGDWNVCIPTNEAWAGDILTKSLRHYGFVPVRGSSRSGGVRALLNMKKKMTEEKCSGAIAMDGPSGPIYNAKPGILFLAEKMGYPIVPLTASAEKKWVLKSTWDQFEIPKPFSRCCVAMGKPIFVDKPAQKIELKALERIMLDWLVRIDQRMGNTINIDIHQES